MSEPLQFPVLLVLLRPLFFILEMAYGLSVTEKGPFEFVLEPRALSVSITSEGKDTQ